MNSDTDKAFDDALLALAILEDRIRHDLRDVYDAQIVRNTYRLIDIMRMKAMGGVNRWNLDAP